MNDFAPLENYQEEKVESTIQRSYWSQAYVSIKQSRPGTIALLLIVFLLLFSLLGPFFWSKDPNQQNLNFVSQAPSFSSRAYIVSTRSSQPNVFELVKDKMPLELAVFGTPHTQLVSLYWPPSTSAESYIIYRHEYAPRHSLDLGLPIGEVYENTFFEDRLQLEPIHYFYSVKALSASGDILDISTIEVKPQIAVSEEQVNQYIEKNIWAIQDIGPNGQYISLPSHPMGTDYLGRDMMARIMKGGQTSLLIGIFASLMYVFIGSVYGAVSAFAGGKVDEVMMRFADFVIALPFILFMILLKVAFGLGPGESGISVMIFSLIVLCWPDSARLVRAQVLVLKEQTYVLAARVNGAGLFYILKRHLIPNVLSILFVNLSFAIPSVILTEAFLSFISLGVVAPTASWGAMSHEGIKTFLFHPHELIFPALFIALTVLAFNVLGDSLRDALDVKSDMKR